MIIVSSNGAPNYSSYDYGNVIKSMRLTQTEHPHQKPLDLLMPLILTCTNEGETVLDPFMGSGTTGVACMRLNRKFIGCEIDPKYYEISESNIKAQASQSNMFKERHLTKRAPDLWDSAPLPSLSTPEADSPAGHLSTPPTSG